MRILKNHPSADQLESFDKYPCYDGNDLELVYTPEHFGRRARTGFV